MKRNKLNKRVLIESLMFPIVIIIAVVGFQVVQGLWLTRNYVPDIINDYASVEHLQQQVAFGIIIRRTWLSTFLEISGFVILAMIYYVLRTRLIQFRKRKK